MPGPEPPDRDLLDRHPWPQDTLLSSFLFCTDLAKIVHEVPDNAVDGIDDDLFLLLLLLFVVTLDCALDGVGVCSARISSMVYFLISFFAMIFLVFCDVNVCFFFDVDRDICKLKRSLNDL